MTEQQNARTRSLEEIVCELRALAHAAREAGMAISWYEPRELRGLHLDLIEDVMTAAANEFIEFNAELPIQLQLTLEIDDESRS